MNDPNILHRELKEQEFSTRSEAGEARYETGTDTEEQQQIAVLGEVVVAKSLVIGGVAVALRWRCGAVQLWWSCGGAPPRLAWPRRRPVVKQMVSGGDEATRDGGAGVVVVRWRGGVAVACRHAWPGRGGGGW